LINKGESRGEKGSGDRKFLFPSSSRLLKPSQYQALFKGGKRISALGLTIIVKPNELKTPRLGITIPKRLVKRAVGRNALKRRIRESFRLNQLKFDGLDIVVMANSGISKIPYQQVSELINPLWQKVAKLKWEES
jgi:ribonuclease P protein component